MRHPIEHAAHIQTSMTLPSRPHPSPGWASL